MIDLPYIDLKWRYKVSASATAALFGACLSKRYFKQHHVFVVGIASIDNARSDQKKLLNSH
jgi:hypothetical protein